MIKTHPHRFFLHLFLLLALSFALPVSAVPADGQWKPVTDELLRNLHLDRRFHKCIAVADGDTITLEELGTVRFIGVDTPEKNHPKFPVQFMSEEAGAFIRKLCLGRNIRLEYDVFDEDKRGNYGRILAYPYLEDGTFLQEQLLLNGYAVCYTKFSFDKKRKQQFLAWEQKAKQKERGIWKNGGRDEILWILKNRQLPIQLEKGASESCYRLRMGNWVSKPIKREEIVPQLKQLYEWGYGLGPRDLKKQLRRSGYDEKPALGNTRDRVMVLGMAHKKWGIVYGNNAKPRVSAEALEPQIRELFKWIRNDDPKLLELTLSLNGYHPVPENLTATLNQKGIAEAFLETELFEKKGRSVIPWESAGKFVGKRVTVQGKIVRGFNSGAACFLNFHRNFTRYMSLVIFQNSFHRFPFHPEEHYLNKVIQVRGKIREYEGRPEMVVESPRQIKIVKNH